ncbi:MBL fold metallo-hydrolase [Paenibacillus ferrarius]|uniref:MBL fold metallo-hydrolase n=1 Tax=Paenibacillus ferrarius TaxID=1469647 RepID=UPI003D276296
MKIQLIRHATLLLTYAGVRFLIDPMFSGREENPPIPNTANDRRNPLVPLPAAVSPNTYAQPDVLVVTHLHRDHWDSAAAAVIPKATPVLCQPGDEAAFQEAGFTSVTAVNASISVHGVTLTRTSGQHGTGEIGRMMGRVSGFVFQAEGEPTVYLAGDTIWCEDVREAIAIHKPEWAILNAGGARFTTGDPITMDADDMIQVCRFAPQLKLVAVHMDAINHCLVTRADLRERLAREGLLEQVMIPEDGEKVVG